MRGCLFVLVIGLAFLTAGAWFGAPLIASQLIETGLQTAGLQATSSTVSVTSSPPLELLLGHADRVEIVATDVTVRTVKAAALDLVLADVDLLNRTAAGISGRISGVAVTTTDGQPASAEVDISGVPTAAAASIMVDASTIDRIVRSEFQKAFGVSVSTTALVAPDVLRIGVLGASIDGRLTIDSSGSLAIATRFGSAPILSLDPSLPIRLRSVRVDAGRLLIESTIDAQALLGG